MDVDAWVSTRNGMAIVEDDPDLVNADAIHSNTFDNDMHRIVWRIGFRCALASIERR